MEQEQRRVGMAIPTWNRYDVLLDSFMEILSDERVSNIHIQDDYSDIEIFDRVKEKIEFINQFTNKITLQRNLENKDCYGNKYLSVFNSKSDWVILGDSDNIFKPDYINKLFEIPYWEIDTIYTPCFAEPYFNFQNYSGLLITKENVADYISKPMFETMLNACNYFVNKNKYLMVWDNTINPVTSDSIYFCYKWLEAGNKIKVVDGLKYYHRVWQQSHYINNIAKTPSGLHQKIIDKIKNLK